jgi:hypothetical protein
MSVLPWFLAKRLWHECIFKICDGMKIGSSWQPLSSPFLAYLSPYFRVRRCSLSMQRWAMSYCNRKGICWAWERCFQKGSTFPSFSNGKFGTFLSSSWMSKDLWLWGYPFAIWFHMYTWWSVIKRCQDSTTLDIISDDICRHILGNDIWTQRDPEYVHITALLFQRVPRKWSS